LSLNISDQNFCYRLYISKTRLSYFVKALTDMFLNFLFAYENMR